MVEMPMGKENAKKLPGVVFIDIVIQIAFIVAAWIDDEAWLPFLADHIAIAIIGTWIKFGDFHSPE